MRSEPDIQKYLKPILSERLNDLEEKLVALEPQEMEQIDNDDMKRIYDLFGNIYMLINELKDNERFLKKVQIKFDSLKDYYQRIYNKDKKCYSSLIHMDLNHLRAKYDEDTEMYLEYYHIVSPINEDFYDSYLGIRDTIEYILIGICVLGQESDFDWIERIKGKIDRVDKELMSILPSLYDDHINYNDLKYIWESHKSITFWWRNMLIQRIKNIKI